MDLSENILNNKELNDISRDKVNKNLGVEFFESVRSDIISNIISQFGLSQFYDNFQDGGSVTTLHNAQKNIFATLEDEQRFNKKFDRKNYEGRIDESGNNNKLSYQRKQLFKNSTVVIDEYQKGNVEIPKNGKTNLDHVVSAHEIHQNDKARLFMDDDKRNDMAVSKTNMATVDSSLNQSKGDKALQDWANNKNKHQLEDNATRYNIDKEKIKEKDTIAREDINQKIKTAENKYYKKNITKEAGKQAYSQAKKAAIGVLSYELVDFIFKLTLPVIKAWNTFPSMKSRIQHIIMIFKQSVSELKSKIIIIAKKIWQGAIDSLVSGIVGQIINTLINTFKTTLGSFGKILNDGIMGVIKAIRVMTSKDSEITREEKMKQGGIILSTALSASIGVLISQSITAVLKSTPLAIFSNEIGILVGSIFTGFMSATMIFSINHFGEIIQKINNELSKIEGTKQNIKKKFNDVINSLDDAYKDILEEILSEYEKLNKLTSLAHDLNSFGKVQFENSIGLANAMGVGSDDMLQSKKDINNFFTR